MVYVDADQHSHYSIVNPGQQAQEVGDDGLLRDVMRVTFRTGAGATGSVSVPLEQYNAESVRRLIEARVSDIAAVAALGE